MSGRCFTTNIQTAAVWLLLALSPFIFTGCKPAEQPVEGFVMPEGDADAGRQVFVDFRCYNCHDIDGVDLPDRGFEPPFVMKIGARLHRVKNSGELLTAVVYPDHVISPKFVAAMKSAGKQADLTPMPNYSDEMTVNELIDLVAFLNDQYTRLLPTYYKSHYPAVR